MTTSGTAASTPTSSTPTTRYPAVETPLGPIPVRAAGEVPTVLAVHGLLTDSRLYDGVVDQLGGRVRVVLPELPLGAHRQAVPDRSRLTPEDLADALAQVLEQVGDGPALVLGNDTGGALSQLLVARHPQLVGGLVLAGCEVLDHFPPPAFAPFFAAARGRRSFRAFVRLFAVPAALAEPGPLNVFSRRGLGRDYVRELLAPALTDDAILDDTRAFVRACRPASLLRGSAGLSVVHGRSAVVWPRHDPLFTPRDGRRAAALLDTEVTWAPGARTFVPVDRPDLVAEAVAEVVARAGTAAVSDR